MQSAELDFVLDLKTLIKENAADTDLIEFQRCLENTKLQQPPEDYKQVVKRLTHRWGIKMVDDRIIIISKSLLYTALNALHFGHTEIKKMYSDATMFWRPNMPTDIENKTKTCSACLNAGKKLESQIRSTENQKLSRPKISEKKCKFFLLETSTLNAVDMNSFWSAAKLCKTTNHDTVITFLRNYINIYGVLKVIKSYKRSAFIPNESRKFCNECQI